MKQLSAISNRERTHRRRNGEILDAAQDLLSHLGYDQMTMDAVAAEAGITKPTLYAYFPGKEELAVAAVGRQMNRATESLAKFASTLSPEKTIEAFARWAVEDRFLDGDALLGSALVKLRSHTEYTMAHRKLLSQLCAVLDRGKDLGTVEAGLNTSVAARFLLSSIRDFSLQEPPDRDGVPPEDETASFVELLRQALFFGPGFPPVK